MYMYCESLSSSDCHLRVLVSNIIFHMTYPPHLVGCPFLNSHVLLYMSLKTLTIVTGCLISVYLERF